MVKRRQENFEWEEVIGSLASATVAQPLVELWTGTVVLLRSAQFWAFDIMPIASWVKQGFFLI